MGTPEVSSSFVLPGVVGMPTAKKWIMLGDWFTAQETQDAGLMLSVEPVAELKGKALTLAQKLAENSETIGLQKRAMHGNTYFRMIEAMDHENRTICAATKAPAFANAMAGFAKKHTK